MKNHLVVERDSVVDLVSDLNSISGDSWAAAVIDDGQIVVTNDRADAYISPGVHLPHNVTLIASNCPDDGVFWQAYGWPPAERLVTYARNFGWLDRITVLVAEQTRPRWSDTERKKVPTDVFEWVRPVLDHHDVELVEFDRFKRTRERMAVHLCELLVHGPDNESVQKGQEQILQPPLVSAGRGGRHRLDAINPNRYQHLVQKIAEGYEVLEELAAITVEAAKNALDRSQPVFASHDSFIFLGAHRRTVDAVELQRQILEIVAATDPADIVSRRLEAISSPDIFIGHNTSDAIGFPAAAAPAWAEYITAAYGDFAGGARHRAQRSAHRHYDAVRGYWPSGETDPAEALNIYVSAECVAIALETIWLWTEDPLPVLDIDYTARMLAN